LEAILGLRLRGNSLIIDPRIPSDWKQFEVTVRLRSATYHVVAENPDGRQHGFHVATIDGKAHTQLILVNDGQTHEVVVRSTNESA
jgi:cellobiose phosphorylase